MRFIVFRIWSLLLRQFQKRCKHPLHSVLADILEGEGKTEIKWCAYCGAFRRDFEKEWREPHPEWQFFRY